MKEIKDLSLKTNEELRKMDEKFLRKELVSVEEKEYKNRMKKEIWELKQTHFLKALRKAAARIKTVAVEKWFKL